MDRLSVTHDGHGTTATLTRRVEQPTRLLAAGDVTGPTPRLRTTDVGSLLIEDVSGTSSPRVRAAGPVDAVTVAALDSVIRVAGVTGTRPVVVDLTEVTQLASVGVAALYRLITVHRDNGAELRLYAPPGTPADMIMTLVRLDHDTAGPDTHDPEGPQP